MARVFMIVAVLIAGAGIALGQEASSGGSLSRVQFRNGNTVECQIEGSTELELTILLRGKRFRVRKDDIVSIDPVKSPPLPAVKTPPVVATLAPPSNKNLPSLDAAVREKVDSNLAQFANASPAYKDQLTRDLAHRPGTGAYLASQLEKVRDEALPYVGRAIWDLQEADSYPYILACLDSSRPGVVAQALILSSRWEGEASVSRVKRFLADSRPLVCAAAIEALRQAGDERSLSDIAQLLRSEDNIVRVTAINASLEMGRKFEKMDLVAASLTDAIDRTRGIAQGDLLEAAGRSLHPGLVSRLIYFLKDSDAFIRMRAAAGLVLNGSADASRAVAQRLRVEDSGSVRIQLVRAAVAMKSTDAIEPLIYLLRDRDENFVKECARALKFLTKQDFGDRYSDWAGWWEQTRRS